MDDTPITIKDILVLSSFVGIVLTVLRYYSAQFANLDAKIIVLEKQDIEYNAAALRAQERLVDLIELVKEVQALHSQETVGLRNEIKDRDRETSRKLQEIQKVVLDLQGFLAKNSSFIIRRHE